MAGKEQERPHIEDNHMRVSVKCGLALMLSAEYYKCHVRLERFISRKMSIPLPQ